MAKMIAKNCKACGAEISVRLADHKRGWGNFCDKACAAAYKTGQRPRDVNAFHAKFSPWAKDRMEQRAGQDPKKVPSVKKQLGKNPKIKHKLHSPGKCVDCGAHVVNARRCNLCQSHQDGLDAMEEGWDGHKIW